MKNPLSILLVCLLVVFPDVFPWPCPIAAFADPTIEELRAGFLDPPMDCRPHTRWWWLGNAVTEKEITWQLEQMHEKGIGGVEIISAFRVYEKGNIPYLSDAFMRMVKHTIQTAKRLGMHVSITFGPGWSLGGYWVPQEDRSQSMVPAVVDLTGPTQFSGPLPRFKKASDRRGEIKVEDIPDVDKLLAVVVGKYADGTIDPATLVELTGKVKNHTLQWNVPAGHWRLMAFWLKYTGQKNAAQDFKPDNWCVDHFNKAAVERYCAFLGEKFLEAFGDEFGKTVDSFFHDSFELAALPNGLYWSDHLLKEFQRVKGYALAPYLPALWWEVGDISPKIRYDVNAFLHQVGLDAVFKTFLDWCQKHGVKGRIQPYGFSTDILEGAGLTHLPEMEITPGEKDAVPWFDTRIGPKKYVASGAHLYGRTVVTAEAYTFIHWEPYRATLEDLKIASDGYFRSGANKLYNHGYNFSPERDVAPSRTVPWAARISHANIWWDYYPLLARYISRCCYLLRQGRPAPDVALYSPLANQWTLNVLNARKWTRQFEWGELGRLLIANGYDFDLVNDDVLQHHADIADGEIRVRNLRYRILILPNIQALPLRTMEFIQQYARGGGVVIALERVPDRAVGFQDHTRKDRKVRTIADEMFKQSRFGQGYTYRITNVINRQDVLDRYSSALDPFLRCLRNHVPPDFGIDFVREGLRENKGLTFVHRKLDDVDVYFVTNIQDRSAEMPVCFRVKGKTPWRWDPYNGGVSRIFCYRQKADGTEIPLRLAPYESTFVLFDNRDDDGHVVQSDFDAIRGWTGNTLEALAGKNGDLHLTLVRGGQSIHKSVAIHDLPCPFLITGRWRLTLQGRDFAKLEETIPGLGSWTDDVRTRHFSGTGRYEVLFDLPERYIADDLQLCLDLGKVGNVADVRINDADVGTCWMRGQTLDVTDTVRAGANRLVVLVTNTLINRVSGFKAPPPVPAELVAHYGSGTTPYSARARGQIGFEPLPASGLMGPVTITARKKVTIPINE